MSNAIRCINQRFAFKNSGISCLALIFNLKNPRMTVLYAKILVAGGEHSAYSQSNPVQSSRSKSMTCKRKGHLLRFKLNSTATSDGCIQKLENNVRRDSELIATKDCSQIYGKWNPMFVSHVVTSLSMAALTGQASIFHLKLFWAISLYKQSFTAVWWMRFWIPSQLSSILAF